MLCNFATFIQFVVGNALCFVHCLHAFIYFFPLMLVPIVNSNDIRPLLHEQQYRFGLHVFNKSNTLNQEGSHVDKPHRTASEVVKLTLATKVMTNWSTWQSSYSWWRQSLRVTGHLSGEYRSLVNSPHKGQWRGALMFSLICAWIKGWLNNHAAYDLRRHRAIYDVVVMAVCDCAMRIFHDWPFRLSFIHNVPAKPGSLFRDISPHGISSSR